MKIKLPSPSGQRAKIVGRKRVYRTPWFSVIAKNVRGIDDSKPYFSLKMNDYVSVLALTKKKEILMVRQFRPAVEVYTLELPSGQVDRGERPIQAARRELLEETGYEARRFEFLGHLFSDTGRSSNKIWCYLATGAVPARPTRPAEVGIEVLTIPESKFGSYMRNSKFNHALNAGLICLAYVKKGLPKL